MLRTCILLLLALLLVGPVNAAIIVPPPVSVPETTTHEADVLAAAKAYRESLKELSGKERRQLKREQRREIKSILGNRQGSDTSKVLLGILCVLLPPLAVFLYEGEINSRFWISLLLSLLFWLPGVVYAFLVVFG